MSKLDNTDHTQKVVASLAKQTKILSWLVALLVISSIFVLAGMPLLNYNPNLPSVTSAPEDDYNEDDYEIIDGIEQSSGFIVDDHWEITKITCTPCHSAKLVTQNRASKEGWKKMIHWMQETQGLWDLGENEEPILNYLAKNYGTSTSGRRAQVEITEWYEIN